jgi:hypothetical protein
MAPAQTIDEYEMIDKRKGWGRCLDLPRKPNQKVALSKK